MRSDSESGLNSRRREMPTTNKEAALLDTKRSEEEIKEAERRKQRTARLNAAISKALAGFKPPEDITVSEWADNKRRLSLESSSEAGQWRTSRTPYLKEIMDAFTDPQVKRIVFVSASQVGKSECINNMIGYVIDQDPGSILFVHPTNGEAREYSTLRIAPMIRDTKCLRDKVADPKSRDTRNTILQKQYPGGILTMCGSIEAHALASKPIRYLFGDERDRWVKSAGDEGDPWMLAQRRQTTYYNAKAVEVSTPTIKSASAIADSYADGTMERYKTKCPHCGEYHEIDFDSIHFEKTEDTEKGKKHFEVTSICYACPGCGGVSTEAEMRRQPCRWEADNPAALANGTRSFWLSAFVSPWMSWKKIILEFLYAKDDPRKLQVVYNTLFGKLWENRGDIEDEESLMARREEYDAELPDGVLMLTIGVDTQDDRFEYEVVGHGRYGETWGIEKGIIIGRPDTDEAWQALDDVIDKVFHFKSGVGLHSTLTFIDESGHYTQDVRLRCRMRQSKKIFPIKGRGGEGIPYTSPPKLYKITIRGRSLGVCKVFELGVDSGKAQIMDNLKVQTPGPKYCHFPRRDDYGTAYFRGLLSEHMEENDNPRAKTRFIWKKIPGHERNEPLDCRNYANAAAKFMAPNWDALEARIRGTTPNAQSASRPAAKPRPRTKRTNVSDEW